jgi:CPA2 family monovalent cation:H+ antiporter-2
MAIGAFFAGLMFANTPYGHQIAGDIIPFRHVFVSIFFVSIGLLLDPYFLFSHLFSILGLVGTVLALNFFVTSIIVMGFGFPPRIALCSGLILAQIGEFSFLLLEDARSSSIIDSHVHQLFLSTAFITIFLTPLLFRLAPLIAAMSERVPFLGMPPTEAHHLAKSPHDHDSDHVILCGYGRVGQDIVMALKQEQTRCVVIEMNPRNVHIAKKEKLEVIYGDASNELVLKKAGVLRARAVVVTFGDDLGMMHIVRAVERVNSDVQLMVRTRYENSAVKLYESGTDVVVMEELEASLELNRQLLNFLHVRPEKIDMHLTKIRMRKELAIEQAIFKHATGIGPISKNDDV